MATGMILVSSCVDDDKLFELDDFETGALPNMQPTANDLGFIDSFNFDTTPIEFTIDFTIDAQQSEDGGLTNGGDGRIETSTEFKPVASVDLEVSYQNALTGTIESAFLTNYTSWPQTVTFTGVSALVEAFESIGSENDLNVGDVFTFVCGVNFEDGTSLPAFIRDANGNALPNFSVNFAGSGNNPGFDFAITRSVACSSNLGGPQTYTAEVNVTGTCCGLATGIQPGGRSNVTVTQIGTGQYEISDALGDHLAVFFGSAPEPLVVLDVCNTLTVDALTCSDASVLCYGPNTQDPAGSYDPATGVFVIKWEDAFGNGIRGVTTLTPN